MSDQLFTEAVTLIKAGDIDKGQRMLMRLVRDNPQHEKAWLWLVNTTPKQVNQIGCLEKVLQINPENQTAQKLIVELKEAQAKAEAEAQKAVSLDSSLGFEYVAVPVNGNNAHVNGNGVHVNGNGASAAQAFEIFQDPVKEPEATSETGKEIPSQNSELIPDPLMVEIEKEQADIEQAALKAAAEIAAQEEVAQKQAQEEAAKKVAAIAQAALEQAARDKNDLDIKKFDEAVEEDKAEPAKKEQVEIKIPEKVYEFPVSLVISKKSGPLGFLFKVKEQVAKATIKVAPDVGILQIKRLDSGAPNEQYNLYFHDIRMIECPEPKVLTFYLQSGKELQLKDVANFNKIVKILSPYVTVRAKQHFIQTPPHFEQRVSQLV